MIARSVKGVSVIGHPPGEDWPPLTEAERQQVRTLVSQAAEAIPLNWPIRTFISRNPLMGFEHLRFDDAVSQAKELLGGEGYLSTAEYRACYAEGRISRDDLLGALRAREPWLATLVGIRMGDRSIHPEEIIFLHLVHGLDPLDPKLLQWQLTQEDATHRIRPDVPASLRQRLRARAAERARVVPEQAGQEETTAAGGPSERISRRIERDPEGSFIRSLWSAALKALELSDGGSVGSPGYHGTAPPAAESGASAPGEGGPRPVGIRTVAERVDGLTESHVVQDVNEQMIKWCAAFADEGMADWSMPSRTGGFYLAWRDLAPRDHSAWSLGVSDWTCRVRELPERPEDALLSILRRLQIPDAQWSDYLRRHLAQLPGWAGFVRWRGANPDYPEQARHGIDPLEYLTVRLFYETVLAETTCLRASGMNGALPEMLTVLEQARHPHLQPHHHSHSYDARTESICRDVWRLFHLAQWLELGPEDVGRLSQEDARILLSWLDRFPPHALRPIWHEAYEARYRDALLAKLASRPRPSDEKPSRPRAQAVFCIDVRSEPFRRQLEAQGGYETIGFAGFFAVPINYRALDRAEDLLLCPVLIKPKYVVREGARPNQDPHLENHLLGERWHETGHHLFHDLKASPGGSYLTIDLFGFLFGLALLGKTVLLEPYHRLRDWLRRWLVPAVPTHIPVEKVTEQERDPAESPQVQLEGLAARGFTPEEQALVVENALRVMSLTKDFARLVLLCGHGSTTENNPYASAYDCGACGGNHGGPNARVLAALSNKPEIRAELRQRRIQVPDDTWFVAGQHDTTRDRVTLLDAEDVPESHRQEWLELQRDLDAAGEQNARERCGRLPGAPRHPSPATAARHVWQRSQDWTQVRPEWGLSGNAAFIIGRRRLTRDLTLDGRTFLHNYDQARDETGKALETIMTAPLVVAQWINFQYFFSAVDPWVYGSGSKVLHNVVSGIGVMLGRHSDLQTGLPLQSVYNGAQLYHEPLRLLAIIEADTGRIADIISRHQILQSFFDNRWVHLVGCDPVTGTFVQYQPGGTWDAVTPQSMEVA